MDLKEIIKSWAKEAISVQFKTGKVTSVDKDKQSCVVLLLSGIELFDVSLRSVLDDSNKGLVVYPKLESQVVVGFINNNENNAFVAQYSEITDVAIYANVIFDSVDNQSKAKKGMVRLSELVDKLNAIEQKINSLVTWSSTHTHTGVTTGAGTSGTAIGVAGNLNLTQESDIENTSIKH